LAYLQLQKFQFALTDLNRALQLKPDYLEAQVQRGLTYHAIGDFQNALRDFTTVLALDARYALAHYYLAQTYKKLGRNELAVGSLVTFQSLVQSPTWQQKARQELEELRKHAGTPRSTQPLRTVQLNPADRAEVLRLLRMGDKVAALKRVAEASGAGLRASKEYVDELIRTELRS